MHMHVLTLVPPLTRRVPVLLGKAAWELGEEGATGHQPLMPENSEWKTQGQGFHQHRRQEAQGVPPWAFSPVF